MKLLRDVIEDPAFPQGARWNYRSFRPGEVIVREGHQSVSMYLVEKGQLRVTGRIELGDGQEARPGLCELGPGDVFGEFGLLEERPRSATVTGVSDGLLIEFDTQALRRYLDEHPALGYQVMKALLGTLIGRLGMANDRLAYVVSWGLTGAATPRP